MFDCGPNFNTPTEYEGIREHDELVKDAKVRVKNCKDLALKTAANADKPDVPHVVALDPTPQPERHVVELTQANYDSYLKDVKDSGKNIYVEYFTLKCPHCKRFAPIWEKVAESLADVIF